MYSFYGGRPGNPFIIVKAFSNVNEMTTEFKKGPAYTEVHYDEYVIINTENKNDEQNGRIYKRGYDYTNENGGAEYIGTVVGPAGPAPKVELLENGANPPSGDEVITTSQDLTVENSSLIPGNENDSINVKAYSVRDANDKDTTLYLQFKIPYFVIDFESQATSPYNDNGKYADQTAITKIDDGSHPFYAKWKLKIPNGIKGDSFKNLKVVTANANIEYTIPSGATYDEEQEINNKKQDDIEKGRKILIYQYYNYNESESGDMKQVYLGDYKMIQDITIDEYGVIEVQYTNTDKTTFLNKIKYIQEISLADDGTLLITYNTINENSEQHQITTFEDALRSISEIRMSNASYEALPSDERAAIREADQSSNEDEEESEESYVNLYPFDGTVAVEYNNGSRQLFPNIIKAVSYMTLEDNGALNVKYINSSEIENIGNISFVNSITYNEDTGEMSYTTNDNNSSRILGSIKEINNFSLSDNGVLSAEYNDDSSSDINTETPIKWIVSIEEKQTNGQLNGDLLITYNTTETDILSKALDAPTNIYLDDLDQKLKVKWKSSQEPTILTPNAINYVKDVAIDSYGHLLMQFSDPAIIHDYPYRSADWKNLGTISATGFSFNDTTTSISNKYLSGILVPEENNLKLSFDLDTAKILNRVTETTINNCSIKIYNNGTLVDTIIIDNNSDPVVQSHSYTISASVFGFSFIFNQINNANNINETTSVNIVIDSMDLNFVLSDETSQEDDEIDLSALAKNVTYLKDSMVGNIAIDPNFYGVSPTITSSLETLKTKIGVTEISSTNTGGSTITESLKNLKTITNKIGSTTINTTFYGTSPTITSALNVLQTKIGTGTISKAKTGGNEIISSLQALKSTVDGFKTSITTTDDITTKGSFIVNGNGHIYLKKSPTAEGASGLHVLWADNNSHLLCYRSQGGLQGHFGWIGSDTYKTQSYLQGYYTYLRSNKGTINTDNLWKTKGDTWTINYAGGGYLTNDSKGLRLTVSIPYIATGTLSITKVTDLTVCRPTGGSIDIGNVTKNCFVYASLHNARIHINELTGLSAIPSNSPIGIVCKIVFKVV